MRKLFSSPVIIISSLLILAAVLRVVALLNFGTYMFDDIFSVHYASKNLTEMWGFLKEEVHPPLYYFLLHFWLKIFGSQEITGRILSLIFNLACLPLIYLLGKKLLNKWIGIFASLIFALSYFQIFTAITIRMYSLMTFLGLAALVLFWLTVVEQKKRFEVWYLLINIALMLTHLGGAFGLLTQWLWFLILKLKKSIDPATQKKFILVQVLTLAAWLAWLVPFLLPKITDIVTQGWYFQAKISRSASLGLYDNFFLLLQNNGLRFLSGIIIFSAPFMVLLWQDKKFKEKLPGKINPNWFLFSWTIPAFLVAVISRVNLTRIYLVAYVGFYLLVANFFYLLTPRLKKTFWVVIIIWLTISTWNLQQNLTRSFVDWRQVNNWLVQNEQPNDRILIYRYIDSLQFQYYYTGHSRYEAFLPNTTNQPLERLIVSGNWQPRITKQNVGQLAAITTGVKRLLVVDETPPPDNYWSDLTNQWLQNNGWQVTNFYRPDTFWGPKIIGYQKLP